MRILVVENTISSANIHDRLRSRGLDSQVATTDKEALALHTQHHFNVIFIDLEAPSVDSERFIAAVHRASPSTKVIPVSAIDDDRIMAQLFARGASVFLTKPVSDDTLAGVLETLETALSA